MFDLLKTLISKDKPPSFFKYSDLSSLLPTITMLCRVSNFKNIHNYIIKSLSYVYYCKPYHVFCYLFYSIPKEKWFKYNKMVKRKQTKEDIIINRLADILGDSPNITRIYYPIISNLIDIKAFKREIGV